MKSTLLKGYDLAEKILTPFGSVVLLVLRLYFGWQLFLSGKGKLANIQNVISFFTELGIPAPSANAYFVSSLEVVGGLLLVLGLFGRFISIPLTINMVVAYVTADREAVTSLFSDAEKFLGAAPFFYLLVAALVLGFGPGLFSLDTLVLRWLRTSRDPAGVPVTR